MRTLFCPGSASMSSLWPKASHAVFAPGGAYTYSCSSVPWSLNFFVAEDEAAHVALQQPTRETDDEHLSRSCSVLGDLLRTKVQQTKAGTEQAILLVCSRLEADDLKTQKGTAAGYRRGERAAQLNAYTHVDSSFCICFGFPCAPQKTSVFHFLSANEL